MANHNQSADTLEFQDNKQTNKQQPIPTQYNLRNNKIVLLQTNFQAELQPFHYMFARYTRHYIKFVMYIIIRLIKIRI